MRDFFTSSWSVVSGNLSGNLCGPILADVTRRQTTGSITDVPAAYEIDEVKAAEARQRAGRRVP